MIIALEKLYERRLLTSDELWSITNVEIKDKRCENVDWIIGQFDNPNESESNVINSD